MSQNQYFFELVPRHGGKTAVIRYGMKKLRHFHRIRIGLWPIVLSDCSQSGCRKQNGYFRKPIAASLTHALAHTCTYTEKPTFKLISCIDLTALAKITLLVSLQTALVDV